MGGEAEAGLGSEQLFALYDAGELDGTMAEFHSVLRRIAASPADCSARPRQSGVPSPPGHYEPLARKRRRPKLVLLGDELTQAEPVGPSASFARALASANPSLTVENAGVAGLLAEHCADPKSFGVALPQPGDFDGWAVCILLGTREALAAVDAGLAADEAAERFERNLRSAVQSFAAAGLLVAVATPPLLGEELASSEAATVLEAIAAAARRVAESESCTLLPLFECMRQRLARRRAEAPLCWTPAEADRRLQENLDCREQEWLSSGRVLPWVECGAEGRGLFCHDLVHLNETGAALHASLCQAWLESVSAKAGGGGLRAVAGGGGLSDGETASGSEDSDCKDSSDRDGDDGSAEGGGRTPDASEGGSADFFRNLYRQSTYLLPWDILGPQPDIVSLQERRAALFSSPCLDVGAGVGGTSLWLTCSLGLDVVACDVSADALQEAQRRYDAAARCDGGGQGRCGSFRSVTCDILDDPPSEGLTVEGQFALALDSAAFHCVGGEAEQRCYVRALSALVRPSGHLVMLTMSDRNPPRSAVAGVQEPHRVSREQLRDFFSPETGWLVEEITGVRYCCVGASLHGEPPRSTVHHAWLLVARRTPAGDADASGQLSC